MGWAGDALDRSASIDETLDDLLVQIERRSVIPVLGQELLTLERDGGPVLLYDELGRRLAERFDVPMPDTSRHVLDVVAGQLIARGQGGPTPREIRTALVHLMRQLGPIPPPEPLRKLASIEPFRFFVSTTFDSLFEAALNAERFGGEVSAAAVVFSPNDPADVPDDGTEQSPRPLIYQLLGSVSSPSQDYVVTEEDALEFAHHLLFERRPARLFRRLQHCDLLIVGCSFPTWLVRFFIRAARGRQLLQARWTGARKDLVVDTLTRMDPALVGFLRGFGTGVEVIENAEPVGFVDELARRWHEAHPGARRDPAQATSAFIRHGSVFLSYAREDVAVARQIRDDLDGHGLDVWFDRHDLPPGTEWEHRIRYNIRHCALFMPVLSASCLTQQSRYFRVEWKYAIEEASRRPATSRFIVPVVAGDLPLEHPDIPEPFSRAQTVGLRGGRIGREALESITAEYREYRKRLQEA